MWWSSANKTNDKKEVIRCQNYTTEISDVEVKLKMSITQRFETYKETKIPAD